MQNPVVGRFTSWARNLRFPQLFVLTAAVLLLDLFVPDLLPFVDEIVLALATLLLGSLRRRKAAGAERPSRRAGGGAPAGDPAD